MAYMNQEKKREIKVVLDKAIEDIGMKGKIKYTLGVRHHSVLVCNVKSCTIDFIKNYNDKVATDNKAYDEGDFRYRRETTTYLDVNHYHLENTFTGKALEVIKAMVNALNTDNYDNSDSQSDYFDVGFYVDLNIGKFDKPFEVLKVKHKARKTKSVAKIKKENREAEFQQLWNAAQEAGHNAGNGHAPTPMVVQQHENMCDDSSPVVFQDTVNDGVCGFAWVQVKPGTSAFAQFLKKNNYARPDSYYGGVCVWVSDYNQSMERKAAHASAMAAVLKDAGINAYSMSRMDEADEFTDPIQMLKDAGFEYVAEGDFDPIVVGSDFPVFVITEPTPHGTPTVLPSGQNYSLRSKK